MRLSKSHVSPVLTNWLISLGLGPATGDVFFLCSSSTGADYLWLKTCGVHKDRIFTTLATAYAALTASRNDTLIVLPGSYVQTAAFTWGKDYTHMIGAAPPIPVNQRCRISAATAALSPLLTFSADGSLMKNIMWSQDGSHATTAAICCYLTGERNRIENVTFRNLGALAVVDNSCRPLKIDSANGENYFKECTIGADTVDGGTATNFMIEFAATNKGNQRQIFDRCVILGNGSANASFIKASDANCINGSWVMFRDCLFSNPMAGDYDQMTQGFSLSTDSNGVIYFVDNIVYGAATFETSNSGVIIGRNAYAADTTDSGVALTF